MRLMDLGFDGDITAREKHEQEPDHTGIYGAALARVSLMRRGAA